MDGYLKYNVIPPVDFLLQQFPDFELNLETPCAHGDDEYGCWLVENASPFNAVLRDIQMELRETRPRRLGLIYRPKMQALNLTKTFKASVMIHILLRYHRCIDFADITNHVLACGFPTIIADALSYNHGLLELNLSCQQLDEIYHTKLTVALCEMTSLEKLRLHRLVIPESLTKPFSEMLSNQPLRTIELIGNEVSVDASERIVKSVCKQGLRVFKYTGNVFGSGATKYLCKLLVDESCGLEQLSLRNVSGFSTPQVIEMAECLANNRSLRVLELQACTLNKSSCFSLMNALISNKSILTLRLVACGIGLSTPQALTELIKRNKVLEDVDVTCNHLQIDSALQLSNALRVNTNLRRLALNGNDFKSDANVALIEALVENKTLDQLLLGYVKMSENLFRALDIAKAYHRVRLHYDSFGVSSMVKCIENRRDVTTIHVDSIESNFDPNCLADLFEALQDACNLKYLYVRVHFPLNSAAAKNLYTLLRKTMSLKRLSLTTRPPDEADMIKVIEGLSENSSVTHFQMDYRALSKLATNALASMFRKNNTLVHFDTLIATEKALKAIAQKMSKNYVLTSIGLWNEMGSDDDVFEINQILHRNASLLRRAVEFSKDPLTFGNKTSEKAYRRLCATDSFENLCKVLEKI